MAKFESREKRQEAEKRKRIHPIWSGIGCIMMVVIPLLSYALADLTIKIGLKNGLPIPFQLLGNAQFPDWAYKVLFIQTFAFFFSSIPNLYAILLFTLIYSVLLFGLLSLGYIMMAGATGRGQASQYDTPRVSVKKKKSR